MTPISSNPTTCADASPQSTQSTLQPDEAIGAFATDHHGLITLAEARSLGVTRKAFRHRVEVGRLVAVQPGVFRCCGAPGTLEQSALAACWSAGDGLTSHRAALEMWGIDVKAASVIEISVTRNCTPDLHDVVVHRSGDLDPDQTVLLRGVPITTVARTLVDLGDVLPRHKVERALEVASYRKLTTIAEVRDLREQLSRRGRNGVGVIGEILDHRGLGLVDTHSPLESLFANFRRDYDLEPPEYQLHVFVKGKDRFIDFGYLAELVAIEVLGFEVHTRNGVFQSDCIRGNELRLAGWQVLEFTWDDIIHRPSYVARCIREALAIARHRLALERQ